MSTQLRGASVSEPRVSCSAGLGGASVQSVAQPFLCFQYVRGLQLIARTGRSRAIPAITAASDIFCLPVLRGEGLSRAVIEGMAYGVTPLVTPVGGNTELVIEGEWGLVVPAGDVKALAQAMEQLYDNPDSRNEYGAAARNRIDRHFRSEHTIEKTLELYQEVMAE